MRPSHIAAAILGVLIAASSAAAQTEYGRLFYLLKIRQEVVIIDEDGRKLRGRVADLSTDRLELATRRGHVDILYNRIVTIDRPSDGLRNGAILGATTAATIGLIGLAVNDTACRTHFRCESNAQWSWPWAIGGGAAFGAVVGAAVDAVTRHARVIYRRGTGVQTTFRPTVGRGVRGAVVSLRW
jgi:hypothetical protein